MVTEPAAKLIDLATTLEADRRQIIDMTGTIISAGMDPVELCNRVALAVRFNKLDQLTKFRAVAEDWTTSQIMLEVYK